MRRLIITISLALGLIAPLVLTASIAARPYDPAGDATVAVDAAPCPTASTSTATVPGGVYRADVSELRQQGYSDAQIHADTRDALVVPTSGTKVRGAANCITTP
jgi:hypothetical protein